MNKIQKYALESGKINIKSLVAVLDELDKKHVINLNHILEVILGMKEVIRVFANNAILNKGERDEINARFLGYDILTDTIRYEYDELLKIWFENEADAKAFSEGGSYYNRKFAYSEREGFKFPGERMVISTGLTSLDEWSACIDL